MGYQWTESQTKAIESRGEGLIVSAAAGSGKTSVLIERLMRILTDETPENRVPIDRIVVVTFTNDAAEEMKTRLAKAFEDALQDQPDNLWLSRQQSLLSSAHISTISSFCFDLIRDNIAESGVTSGFRILDETENTMLCEKEIDRLFSRWHIERPEDMKILWNAFCEKNDNPLADILMELHNFLGSVAFPTQWMRQARQKIEQTQWETAQQDFYHQIYGLLKESYTMAKEAANLAEDLYENTDENTLIPFLERDRKLIHKVMLAAKRGKSEDTLEACRHLVAERKGKNVPRKKKSILDDASYAQVRQIYQQYKEILDDTVDQIEMILPYEDVDFSDYQKIIPLVLEMSQELSENIFQEKVRRNALGFEDGEQLALQLLSEERPDGTIVPSALAKELAGFYSLIMVDEYQDANNKQNAIFQLLSKDNVDPATDALRYGKNMFLVGDVKQSIYRFRLANPQNFIHAIDSAASPRSVCRHITLSENFRSAASILSFVNFVCGNLMSLECGGVNYNENEALKPGSHNYDRLSDTETSVEVVEISEENENETIPAQVEYIMHRIREMMDDKFSVVEKDGRKRPCEYRDFCILLRNNAQLREYAKYFEEAEIPVTSPDEEGYLTSREIQILLDMLRILDNPLLDTSLAAVMLSPMFLFSAQDLLKIHTLQPNEKLYTALCAMAEQEPTSQDEIVLVKKCRDMLKMLRQLRQNIGMMSLEALVRQIYDSTDFLSVIRCTENGERKYANLQLLLQYVRQYESTSAPTEQGISGFLSYVDWLIESKKDWAQTPISTEAGNAIILKTMHKSKGLEFPIVFLSGLEKNFSTSDKRKPVLFSDDGTIGLRIKDPISHTKAKTLPYLRLESENETYEKSEELRLLYVAMTRAKQKLILALRYDEEKKSDWELEIAHHERIPASLVASVKSMSDWIWICLARLENVQTEENPLNLSRSTFQATGKLPTKRILEEEKIPDTADTDPLQNLIQFSATTPESRQLATYDIDDLQEMMQFSAGTSDSNQLSVYNVSSFTERERADGIVWETPKFRQKTTHLVGAERGTAIHAFFQYADFSAAQENFAAEKDRLVHEGHLTQPQIDAVTRNIVDAFFHDPIYVRFRNAKKILREYRFQVVCRDLQPYAEMKSVLAEQYQSDSMLKGMIDLAFLEKDGYVLVDYKTDYVTAPEELISIYRNQILLYRAALMCITNIPVISCYLYSTRLQKSIPIPVEGESYHART